jgi:hypothetical protein
VYSRATALGALVLVLATCRTAPEPVAPELATLSPELHEAAHGVLAERDPVQRGERVRQFAVAHGAAGHPFLVELLARDPDAVVRVRAAKALGPSRDPAVQRALEECAAWDADVEVATAALEELDLARAAELADIARERFGRTEPANGAERARLAELHDRLVTTAAGGMLPGFLRRAPPRFEVLPEKRRAIRVVAFGDFGTGSEDQVRTARALARFHRKERIDLGLTLGDNFYPRGMDSPQDARWKTQWSDLYAGLGIPFYATLGNHDWNQPDSPAAELLFERPGSAWHMPAARYTFTAGPAQFFALDTTTLSLAQLDWLDRELAASRARWKIVYGHHPIRSSGMHGDTAHMVQDLLPLLAGRAHLYLAGHDHDMQHLHPEGGVQLFVAGSGGARVRAGGAGSAPLFRASSYGFAVLDVAADRLRVRFVDSAGAELYAYEMLN